MKDRLLLLIASLLCAVAASAFWRFSGQSGFLVLITVAYAILLADNYRLRKALRFYRPKS